MRDRRATDRVLEDLLQGVGDEALLRVALAALEVKLSLVEESLGPAAPEVVTILQSSRTLLAARDERALASIRRSIRPLGESLSEDRPRDAMAVLEMVAMAIAEFITGGSDRRALAHMAAYEHGYVLFLAERCTSASRRERFDVAQSEYDRRFFRALDRQPGW